MNRHYINSLDLLVVVVVVFPFGTTYMWNMQVLLFVDNTVCLSSYVHGYARFPQSAQWIGFDLQVTQGRGGEVLQQRRFSRLDIPMCLPSFDDLRDPRLETVEYCFLMKLFTGQVDTTVFGGQVDTVRMGG